MLNFINNIDISIVKFIQNYLSFGLLDYIMYGITQLGDLYAFILLAVILYWAIDKRFAYKFFFAFVGSALVNSVLKVIVQRPRPYNEPGIESVFTKTHGYSFPSGHSQATGVIFYSMNNEFGKKNKIIRGLLIALLVLVPLSRVYLGQHYLTDVIAGASIGILMSYLMFKLFDLMKDKEHIYPLFIIPVIVVIMIIFRNGDYGSYKDLFVAAGGYIGFTSGYAIEKIYVKHDVKTNIQNKILKVLIGLIGVAIVYFGLKFVFPNNNLLLDSLRYALVALFAALGAPFLFAKIFKNNKEI